MRDAALKLAGGNCERCGQQGFLTATGERYLETHHVVGVAERGPDAIDNIVAICPNRHRQAMSRPTESKSSAISWKRYGAAVRNGARPADEP